MKKLLSFLVFLLLGTAAVLGQSQNGSVSGVITDATGATVANAAVTVTNVATGATRTATSSNSGDYNIQGLPPQDYKISVTAPGFGTTTTSSFNVSVGSANTVNAKLSIQSSTEQIEVTANSLAGINLENAENSQVISTQQILELPTETRNPYDLVNLSGSVSGDPSATSRGAGVNISGSRSASTEILLDGIENTQLFSVGVATPIPLDATQEFRVITSNFGPEYGRASGGVVNVITKSGTNAFHGTAYEFYRPSTFAANSYYNNAQRPQIPQHRFVRNNFGYSIGGPVLHDKLFFYSSTEWLRVRSSNVVQYYIPTSQFLAASDPRTKAFFTQFGTVSGAPTGNLLTLGDIGGATASSPSTAFSTDRTTLEALPGGTFNDAFPVLQQVNVTVPIDAGGGTPQNTYNTIGRLDFNLSSRTQMYARYVLYHYATPVGSGNRSPYAGYSTLTETKAQNMVYGLTHSFSSFFTSQLQIGLLRSNVNQPLGANPAGPTLFINSGVAPTIANNLLVFPGYSEENAGNGLPSGGPQNNIVISPEFTYTKGRHTMTFGGQYTYVRDNHTFAIYENAQESLVQTGTAGALINLQAGVFNYFQANLDPQGKFPCSKDLVTGVTPGISNGSAFNPACTLTTPINQPNFSRSNRYHEGAGYFNDSWKATTRLTIDAGLRYELYGTQHNKNAALDSNFYFGTTGTLQDRVRAGKILQVNAAAPPGVQNPNGKLWNTNYKQFAPRLSFAYDLTGDGKTSLRGGYGLSYERNFGNVTYNVALNPPAQLAISFTNNDLGGVSIPISTGVLGTFSSNGANGPVQKAIPPGTVRAVDPKIKPAYNQFYTLAVERQVKPSLSAGLAYTGERGIHNYSIANYNRSYYGQVYENDPALYAAPNATTKNSNRLNPQFSSINVRGADGDSYYNGANAFVRGSNLFGSGVTVTANYTFSHSTDNTSSTFTDGQANGQVGGVAYFDPYNHAIDHGNSDFDVKHRVSTSVLWAIPYGHASGFTRAALGGWEVGAIFSANTGTPFTMYDCGLPAITACPRARFVQPPSYQRTGDATIPTTTPDVFGYITFPTYYLPGPPDSKGKPTKVRNTAAYGTYLDPKTNYTSTNPASPVGPSGVLTGAADLPTIVNGVDTFPGGMTARNAFRGPGAMTFNIDVNKSIKFTERYSLQLRAEAYNVLNHANSYLTLGSANDVSQQPYEPIQKNGPGQGNNRQLQLAGKIVF